ncbi:putative nucleic acid-binding protein [Halopolyspora algeriensis]|uniref:Ribonuclease VapC n=1 Tax=Halopolyspora algeriensis TaxID=1500506 RepID=A0A368VFZ7_9ACTN|nr:PIN domain-containing protein [Halopolyspora algeriensis]RCW39200.1 putative nucleic acid-binding protein [Halopolyspora algeriensis]TQM47433.1 putative nucleic acid-binding protein [Halopolyspora algeriensis]
MIVVDTSTLVAFYLGANHSGPKVRKALGCDTHWAAPVHQPAEMLNVLRGLVLGRRISKEDAAGVLDRWSSTYIEKLPFSSAVIERVWELRNNVSAYDAAYVAVAEMHELALVTGDGRLANAPGIRCELRLVR